MTQVIELGDTEELAFLDDVTWDVPGSKTLTELLNMETQSYVEFDLSASENHPERAIALYIISIYGGALLVGTSPPLIDDRLVY